MFLIISGDITIGYVKTLVITFLLFLSFQPAGAETTASASPSTSDSLDTRYIAIDKVFILGNKVTKEKIILREMDIRAGKKYEEQDLQALLKLDRSKILNTRLFVTVELSLLKLSDNLADVVVKVTERWYTFPAPIFGLPDRNFNDWWQNQNADLSRTNFGVSIYRNNFRGRNENLRATIQLGYTKRFNLFYRIPYVDKKQKHGISFLFDYAENKNIAYRTIEHKRLFFDSEDLLLVSRRIGLGYRFRNSFYTRHSLGLSFNNNDVNDTIPELNGNYFLNGQEEQKYFEVSYAMSIDKRDFNYYPLKGHYTEVIATKTGIGAFNDIDKFDLNVRYARYSDLGKGFFLANYSSIFLSTPKRQPYPELGALGFNKDFIRGYELYVVEGQQYYLNRTTFKKRILSIKKRMNFVPIEQFREFPLDIYLKTYFDMGYVDNYENYEQNSLLTNRFLFGTGLGIDIVTYYDTVIRLELSINREQESGFFLHFKKEF